MSASHLKLAQELLLVWPLVGRVIRQQVHKLTKGTLTIPQYRVLKYVSEGCNQVGRLAIVHGISQPSMSKIIEGLVRKGLMKKQASKTDRRQVNLKLSAKGEKLLQLLQKNIESAIQEKIDKLSTNESVTVCDSLQIIKRAFLFEVSEDRSSLLPWE